MPWVAAAAAVAAAAMQANSANRASRAQANAENAATAEQARQFDVARDDSAPWRSAGTAGVRRLSEMLGLQSFGPVGQNYTGQLVDTSSGVPRPVKDLYDTDPVYRKAWDEAEARHKADWRGQGYLQDTNVADVERWVRSGLPMTAAQQQQPSHFGELNKQFTVADFHNDPVNQLGFQYGLDMGTDAINRGAGAAGLRNSGATLKALTRFGQDYAGSKAGESYNRFYGDQDRIFNRLAGISGLGQTATANTSALGQNSANNIANIMTAGGNARGAAAIAQGNAYGGALNTIGNYYGQQSTLDKILNSRNQTQTYDYNANAPS